MEQPDAGEGHSDAEFIALGDDLVIEKCNEYGIAMAFTGIRLFHH